MAKQAFKSKYGTWALVTGASSGIGREIAVLLAQRGLNIVLVGRDSTRLEEVNAIIQSNGVQTKVISAELEEAKEVNRVLEEVSSLEIGLFVGAAGFGSTGPFSEMPIHTESAMIDVNCRTVMIMTQDLGRKMLDRKRGGVILFSSLVGWQGTPISASYAATKAYVQSFAEAIAIEWKPQGVDVLVAAPGPVMTRFGKEANMNVEKADAADKVAIEIVNALGKRTTVVPGNFAKFLTYSLFMCPRPVRVRIMQKVMSGMTKHGK